MLVGLRVTLARSGDEQRKNRRHRPDRQRKMNPHCKLRRGFTQRRPAYAAPASTASRRRRSTAGAKYDGLQVSDAKRFRGPEDENRRLKKLVADFRTNVSRGAPPEDHPRGGCEAHCCVSRVHRGVSRTHREVSRSHHELLRSHCEVSRAHYEVSRAHYEVSRAHYEVSRAHYEVSRAHCEVSRAHCEVSRAHCEVFPRDCQVTPRESQVLAPKSNVPMYAADRRMF